MSFELILIIGIVYEYIGYRVFRHFFDRDMENAGYVTGREFGAYCLIGFILWPIYALHKLGEWFNEVMERKMFIAKWKREEK